MPAFANISEWQQSVRMNGALFLCEEKEAARSVVVDLVRAVAHATGTAEISDDGAQDEGPANAALAALRGKADDEEEGEQGSGAAVLAMDTKYYTAEVACTVGTVEEGVAGGGGGSGDPNSQRQAVVVVEVCKAAGAIAESAAEGKDKAKALVARAGAVKEAAQSWAGGEPDLFALVLAGPSPPDAIVVDEVQKWCYANAFELVVDAGDRDLSALRAALGKREKTGVARLLEALQTVMWPVMDFKTGLRPFASGVGVGGVGGASASAAASASASASAAAAAAAGVTGETEVKGEKEEKKKGKKKGKKEEKKEKEKEKEESGGAGGGANPEAELAALEAMFEEARKIRDINTCVQPSLFSPLSLSLSLSLSFLFLPPLSPLLLLSPLLPLSLSLSLV